MLDASSLGAMQNRRHGGVRVSQRRTVNDLLDAARAQIDRLEPMAARAAAERGAIVVDTRCAEQRRETGVIPGSIHVPLFEAWQAAGLPIEAAPE